MLLLADFDKLSPRCAVSRLWALSLSKCYGIKSKSAPKFACNTRSAYSCRHPRVGVDGAVHSARRRARVSSGTSKSKRSSFYVQLDQVAVADECQRPADGCFWCYV